MYEASAKKPLRLSSFCTKSANPGWLILFQRLFIGEAVWQLV